MISLLTGTVEDVSLGGLVISTGGVGWGVSVTANTAANLRVGQEARVFIHMVVREDALTLYGFLTADERNVFTSIQKVSGVGPRIALAALSVLTPDQLRHALIDEDLSVLQKIPGVGRKLASRVALEIGDKLGHPSGDGEEAGAVGRSDDPAGAATEVIAALVQLGWPQATAERSVAGVEDGQDAATLLRLALRKLGNTRG